MLRLRYPAMKRCLLWTIPISPCSRGQSSKYMPMFHRFHRFHSYVSDLGRVSGNWWQLAGKPLIIRAQLVGVCPTPWCPNLKPSSGAFNWIYKCSQQRVNESHTRT
jgi:hypothetical protein